MGNEASAFGLVELGCRAAAAYPSAQSSEILPRGVKFKTRLDRLIYTEWSTNEKIAIDVDLAASRRGLRLTQLPITPNRLLATIDQKHRSEE
jgi:indolepyruvate ferredoxin oxidoreductase alpha subunit